MQQQQQQQQATAASSSAASSPASSAPPCDRLTKWDFLMLNALGDMDDLMGERGGGGRGGGER